jgi:hypothetical protein
MKKALFLSGIIILLFSCINSRKLMNNSDISRIYFGKRGGFTNIPDEYVLFEKGQLYKIRNDTLLRIHRISRTQLETIDSLLIVTDFKELNINEYGNITYFIKVVRTDYEKEANWADISKVDSLKKLYNTLLTTIIK